MLYAATARPSAPLVRLVSRARLRGGCGWIRWSAPACPRLPRCLSGSASVGKPSSLTWCCRSSAVSGYQALPLDSDHTNSKPTAACSVCLHSTYARQPPLTALPGHPAARFALRITRLLRDPHRSRLRRWPG